MSLNWRLLVMAVLTEYLLMSRTTQQAGQPAQKFRRYFPVVETMEELLTVQEVASRLRVNEATVRRWIKNGSLEAIKLPHRGKREIYRVRRSTLSSVLKDFEASRA
jgi:excisionase family DNA binding protein